MIELNNVSVAFRQKKETIHAVKNVSLQISRGDIFGIVGYSGAGKSTLIRLINLLQRPSRGEVIIQGKNILTLNKKSLRAERKKMGMIFQHFNLMEQRTVYENIHFALKYSGIKKEQRAEKITSLLELVGLSDKKNAYPNQLSGGQKQRVAIARALANDPEILLCDEATSALDPKTTTQILKLLRELNQKLNLTIVLITHEMQVVKELCNRVAIMEAGEIIEQESIVSIFSQPKKNLTKDFIRTATHIDQALENIWQHPTLAHLTDNELLVELSYVGEQTSEPLLTALYSRYQVTTNILYGNIEILQQTPVGSLIAILSGETLQQEKALLFLKTQNVTVTLLKQHAPKNEGQKLTKGGTNNE